MCTFKIMELNWSSERMLWVQSLKLVMPMTLNVHTTLITQSSFLPIKVFKAF